MASLGRRRLPALRSPSPRPPPPLFLPQLVPGASQGQVLPVTQTFLASYQLASLPQPLPVPFPTSSGIRPTQPLRCHTHTQPRGPSGCPVNGPATCSLPCKGARDPIQTPQRPLSSCTSVRHFSFKKPSKSLTWRYTLLKAKAVWELGWELPEGRSAGEMTARVRQQVGAEPGRPHAPQSILQSQRWVGSRNQGQGGGWEKSGEDLRRTTAESLGIQQGRAASSWSLHKAKIPPGPAIPRTARLWLPLSGLGGAWCPGLTPPAGPSLGRRTQGPSPSLARPCSRDSRRPRAAEVPALPTDDYRVSAEKAARAQPRGARPAYQLCQVSG